MIYIGGAHEKPLIELHDMKFIIAENIEETYDELRRRGWGILKNLNLPANIRLLANKKIHFCHFFHPLDAIIYNCRKNLNMPLHLNRL